MAQALLALVFGFNIKPIHSAVDMGNLSSKIKYMYLDFMRMHMDIAEGSKIKQ